MFKRVILIASLSVLAGCGFQPLYAPHDSLVSRELYSIKVNRIDDREGQILRNQIQHLLNPYGTPAHPLYSLTAKAFFTREDLGFRKDATPRRARIRAKVDFSLTDLETGKVVLADELISFTGFTLGSTAELSAFPEIVSEEDARKRLLELLAEEIKIRISAYLIGKDNFKKS